MSSGLGRWRLAMLGIGVMAGLWQPASAYACSKTGKLSHLMAYAGTMYGDLPTTLDNDPAVQARLARLPAPVRAHLQRNLDVRGPVNLVSCHLVLSGNAAHRGGEENAILDVNLYSGAVTAAVLSGGHITIYLDKDPTTAGTGYVGAVPVAVRRWAAAAATGFQSLQRPPPNTRLVAPPP